MMPDPDLISCLMVTQAARWKDGTPAGLASYVDQEHEHRELVIVTADPCAEMFEAVEANWRRPDCAESSLGTIDVMPQGSTLGQLRQRAVELAGGLYVATWDDDDLSHPQRLSRQLDVLKALPLAEAVCLLRVTIMDQIARREFVSPLHAWEMTMLARRECVPPYNPALQLGEDTESILRMRQHVLLDRPELYVHVVHPGSTVGAKLAPEWFRHRTDDVPILDRTALRWWLR